MDTNMPGHNHSGKGHLLWMLGLGGVIFVVLLGTGRSVGQASLLALFLACPLMMVGMMFMMGGDKGHQHDNDPTDHQHDNDPTDRQGHEAPESWQDSPNISRPPQPPKTTSWT